MQACTRAAYIYKSFVQYVGEINLYMEIRLELQALALGGMLQDLMFWCSSVGDRYCPNFLLKAIFELAVAILKAILKIVRI